MKWGIENCAIDRSWITHSQELMSQPQRTEMTGSTPLYDMAQVRSISKNFKTTGDWQIARKVLLLFAFLRNLNPVTDLFIFGHAFCREFS